MNSIITTETIIQIMPVPVISKEKFLPMKDSTVSTIPESNKNIVKAKKMKPRIVKIIIEDLLCRGYYIFYKYFYYILIINKDACFVNLCKVYFAYLSII